jgi:hypothetical protein
VEAFVVRARPWYLRKKVLLTVSDEGVVSPACGLVPWRAIRSLPTGSHAYGRYLEIDVYDRDEYIDRIERGWLRRLARACNVVFREPPFLAMSEQLTGVAPEALRVEIEARAGRTFPH